MLAGCATGPEPELVAVVVPPPVYATDLPPAGLDEAWWRGFGDPALNDLVARGLAANLDIDAATDRLDAAAALLAAERSDRLPTLDAAGEAGVDLGSDNRVRASAGLFGLFDPDLNGRLAAEIRAAAADLSLIHI